MTRALTDFQVDVLALAESGLSNREIATATEKPFACIITTLTNIKRKGHKVPAHRPLDATPEKTQERQERQGVPDYCAALRFTARGVKPSTGERFVVRFADPGQLYDAAFTLAEQVGVELMDG